MANIEKSIFSQPWSKKGFLEAYNQKQNIILVADEEGEICGYICMYVSFDEGEITNVAVKEKYRGRGLGKAIVKDLLDRAAKANVSRCILEVRKSNAPAISLYKKMNFNEIGVRKGFYDFPKEDALIMEYIKKDEE